MLILLLYLILLNCSFGVSNGEELKDSEQCYMRCLADCFYSKEKTIDECYGLCDDYRNDHLCNDSSCWRTCNGLSIPVANSNIPDDVVYSFTPSSAINMSWSDFENSIYLLQYSMDENFTIQNQLLLQQPYILNWAKNIGGFCDEVLIRLASVTANGVSRFSEPYVIERPVPQLNSALSVESMTYLDVPYDDRSYQSNGTVKLVMRFERTEWPLGVSDLDVVPLFHMINCEVPDLSAAIPNPQFHPGEKPYTIESSFGAALMYRRCNFLYTIGEVNSKQCGTRLDFNDNFTVMKTLRIECKAVINSPCPEPPKRHPPPLCGQIEAFNYNIISIVTDSNNSDEENVTIGVTFRSTLDINKQPLYFVAFYGNARQFERQIDMDLLGVNMTNILGNATNCPMFKEDGTCKTELDPVNGSFVITNLRMETLYGMLICAVIDVENLTFPTIPQGLRTKANKIYIEEPPDEMSKAGLIFVVGCVAITVILIFVILVFVILHYKQKRQMIMNQFKLQQLKLENEQRYTDCPKKYDIWELERRNLIIYDDRKLGAGAFGTVFMGRLIGVAKAHKDAQSTLGVNLMRAENCDVAVKMLPEYADEMSKSEFMKEISLMKTLGYHERLVNMLACITDSEPYCLVVEYCSDGDLLQFLRDRCKYMLKLTDMGIDYDNPMSDADFDVDMIITLKQLLMFAVQISYGLEYLSQKGFVHRDVAARNVLVHDKTNAKIGDFGLCRYIYAQSANYKGKGGRLPVKWMSPEAIKYYEFTTKSDVWSFGILMFEIITLGGSPYPGIQPDDMMEHLDAGERMEKPDNCPDDFYELMKWCWAKEPAKRPEFGTIRQRLAAQLEEVTDEYSYLKLDSQRDYYNVPYGGVTTRDQEAMSTSGDDKSALKELNESELATLEDIPLSPSSSATTLDPAMKSDGDACTCPHPQQQQQPSESEQNPAALSLSSYISQDANQSPSHCQGEPTNQKCHINRAFVLR